jgi:uncharacterized Fe-S cluster-containing radical SAM superfamily protein
MLLCGWHRALIYVPLIIFLGKLLACTTIHIAGVEPKVLREFGIVSIELPPGIQAPVLVRKAGMGIVLTTNTITIGAAREFMQVFPDASACHTVIVIQNPQEFEMLRQILSSKPESFNHICIAPKEETTWPP